MCICLQKSECVRAVSGPGLLKAAVPQINIQAPTRFSKEEQGVMGDAGKIISPVQRWREEKHGGKENAQNMREK